MTAPAAKSLVNLPVVSAPAVAASPAHAYVLDGTETAPARARRHVRMDLTALRLPEECIERAVLVVSELATNAVRHTGSERIRLEIEPFADEVHVAVRDSGPRPQTPLHQIAVEQGDPADCEHGRGLDIVRQLSTRWGSSPTPGAGLRVWAAIERRDAE